jgi:hypothetical protein
MDEQQSKIPNTDFRNDKGLVTLSFRKVDGGFFMTEGFSKAEYAIPHAGAIHGLISEVGKEMLMELERRFKSMKKNEVLTTDFQIRQGGLSFMFGQGIIGLTGPTESTLISHIMNTVVYVLGVNPSIFNGKKYKTTQEGFVMFVEDIKKNYSSPYKDVFRSPETPNFFGSVGYPGTIIPLNSYAQGIGNVDFIEVVNDSHLSSGHNESPSDTVTEKGRIRT